MVIVEVTRRLPFTFVVILLPTSNAPSILAVSMGPPGQLSGSVHTAHASSGVAVDRHEPSKLRRASAMIGPSPITFRAASRTGVDALCRGKAARLSGFPGVME